MGKNKNNGRITDTGSIRIKYKKLKTICSELEHGQYPGISHAYESNKNGSNGYTPDTICEVPIILTDAERSTIREFRGRLKKSGVSNAYIKLP